MSNNVSGVVKGVYSKDITTRFGLRKTWDILLDNGQYYKNGFKKPSVEIGDSVTIDFEVGKYGNEIKNMSSGAGTACAVGATKPEVSLNSNSGKYMKNTVTPFPVPPDHGDRSIIRQNSLTNARELVQSYFAGHSISFDDEVQKIIETAYKFEEYSSGDREVKAADAITNKNKVKSTKAKTPKEDNDGPEEV